ncbi:class I SAM-dependent methyltransferase [Paraburkholderia rhynchosiae]|uniref:Class I SAM-dependent methyltransferase n=1 Tax=Paraburkholderia rhynchosiae TaxID=487049 RepID=A0A2N7WGU9_9BURK|nr:class I SAM-dependent methyltransferase [Paraburkholderia rhynchosiae]PMS28612.1 class I SAM-dependent methyltransferase [Paraburkholderia rhynchosiae]CAB3713428.1 Ubiquinone biosynthesis O-methyltransferase, mitochondrial [Paraburkholderia rhynchosiae]
MARDYNAEARNHPDHRYAYEFDYLMHEYMLRTLSPFFVEGNALELGCFEGHFSHLLAQRFASVEVVEASADCIPVASEKVKRSVKFHHSTFEKFEPTRRYDNIFLIHTLEHLDHPVEVLRRIAGWLSEGGRLFVAAPNARAGSRQIAVKMGLIDHPAAVTAAEAAHGHRVTYSIDTLCADLRAAKLRLVTEGGVFFKGLANFQIDAALRADIISKEYLDGCFELGRVYPDLCSSVYAICERDILK